MCLFDNKIERFAVFFFRPIEVKKHEKSGNRTFECSRVSSLILFPVSF